MGAVGSGGGDSTDKMVLETVTSMLETSFMPAFLSPSTRSAGATALMKRRKLKLKTKWQQN